MNIKKRLKRFFTLTRRPNGGFTLVELIVVIAILAVLGGVGTAAYGGYIESTKKKADQVLVGGIIRAIEIGTNSAMFTNNDSFKMGEIAYPVGFITLSADESGTQIITSHTEKIEGITEGACRLQSITYSYVDKNGKSNEPCPNNGSKCNKDVYALLTKTVVCCVNHSRFEDTTSEIDTGKAKAYTHVGELDDCDNCSHDYNVSETVKVPAGTSYYVTKESNIFETSPNPNMCKLAYANQNDIFLEDHNIDVAIDGDPVLESVKAAFGNDLSKLQLQYDSWVTEEGVDYATFYTSAPEMLEDVESLSELLVSAYTAASWLGQEGKLGLTKEYGSGEEVLAGVADNIVAACNTEAKWMEQWNSAGSQTWDSFGFGLAGRETYSAARVAYNNGFASYVDARDPSIEDKYLNEIKDFYSQEMFGVGLPGLVCTDAFTDTASPLKNNLKDAGDSDGAVFNKLAAHFEEYKTSTACQENGKVFYKVIATFQQTSDLAMDLNNITGGDMYAYYDRYIDEVAEMYSQAQEAAAGGVVIIVTVENGNVKCLVSPSVADPRDVN